ncbi:MAG: terpene cyclase/mutase family protein [Candidatus Kerfeldbacteria bacterium]|nr:terpene cyclase/mutase family protein [Candidatus Kerfeldbacteria bacterium]
MPRSRIILSSIVLALTPLFVAASAPQDVVQLALTYLRGRQDADGKIESPATSAWAAIAVGAAGEEAGSALRHYLTTHHPSAEEPVTEWERRVLAFLAMGVDPAAVDGRDYLATIEGFGKGGQIGDPNLLNDDMFGILALIGGGRPPASPIVAQTAQFLLDSQNADGGWGFAIGMPSDVDLTGVMLQIMPLLDMPSPPSASLWYEVQRAELGSPGSDVSSTKPWRVAQERAIAFLRLVQNPDGGFPNSRGGQSNIASTAWVLQGLAAAGEAPALWAQETATPLLYLMSAQRPDGSFPWFRGGPASALMTSYAVPAILAKPLPIRYTPPPPADPPPPPPSPEEPLPPLFPPSPVNTAPQEQLQPVLPAPSPSSENPPPSPAAAPSLERQAETAEQAHIVQQEPFGISRVNVSSPPTRKKSLPKQSDRAPALNIAGEQNTAAASSPSPSVAPTIPVSRSVALTPQKTVVSSSVSRHTFFSFLELSLLALLAGSGSVVIWLRERKRR